MEKQLNEMQKNLISSLYSPIVKESQVILFPLLVIHYLLIFARKLGWAFVVDRVTSHGRANHSQKKKY